MDIKIQIDYTLFLMLVLVSLLYCLDKKVLHVSLRYETLISSIENDDDN